MHVEREQPFYVVITTHTTSIAIFTPSSSRSRRHKPVRQEPIRRRDRAPAPDIIETHGRRNHPHPSHNPSRLVHKTIPNRTHRDKNARQNAKRRVVSRPLVFRLFPVLAVPVDFLRPVGEKQAHLPQRVFEIQ